MVYLLCKWTLPIIVETTQFFIGLELEASKTAMTRLADDKSTGYFALWYSVWVVSSILVPFLFTTQKPLPNIRVFADSVFKIRLIRLGFSFKKLKIPVLYLNSQPTDSQSRVLTITPKSRLWVGDTEKLLVAFSHAWLILVEVS